MNEVRASGSADAVWTLRAGGDQVRFVVEVKRTVLPRDVQRIAAHLEQAKQEEQAECLILVTSSLTRRTRELLKDCDISYVDLRGHLRLIVPGRVLVVANADSEPFRTDEGTGSPDRIANPFRGKASRIVRALLANPARWWEVTEIAKSVDVSVGLVAKTLRSLEEEAYTRRDKRRRVRLRDAEPLLRRWAERSMNPFRRSARFTSTVGDPDAITSELASALSGTGRRYAITRLAAARFVEPYAPAAVVDIYVDDDPGSVGEDLQLYPVDRGESVRLVNPDDTGAFQFRAVTSGITIVNPVQLYVDLRNGGGREPEVAEQLLANRLRRDLLAESEG